MHQETKVFGCFLDAGKAFDRVSHNNLFNILEKRGLPPPLLRFLWSWYKDQSCTVKWNSYEDNPFGVLNGVRQGGGGGGVYGLIGISRLDFTRTRSS